ncbi:hypothetical protein CL622_03705 [archaeon]|nr:hypothetical protein [archaeon]|tara:strand:- start:648 stop:1379 length:732 start_codon:yes stop_codon:yes gene_type:complete
MICKNIHQIWIGDKPIPEICNTWMDSWRDNHPDWNYTFWTDDDIIQLIERKYSWFLDVYNNYEYDVNRSDAARYLILYEYGGVYCDIDIECFKCIEPLITDECVLFNEHPDHTLGEYFPPNVEIQTNSIYYAAPGAKFIWHNIRSLTWAFNNRHKYTNPGARVLMTTASGFLTICYNKYVHVKSNVSLAAHEHFELLSKRDRKDILLNNKEYKKKNMYGIHWNIGTWIINEKSPHKIELTNEA